MPFPEQTPEEFNSASVEALKPNQIGCYGLYRHDAMVYIGKGNIKQRLRDHLIGDNPCITRENPTHWIAVITNDPDTREKELIQEYDPICNKRVG